nr:MAG TPA_asm: hypothetical protein [Caudoviricetes sp.]
MQRHGGARLRQAMEWQGKAGKSKGYEMQGVALICKGNARQRQRIETIG